MRVRSVRDFHRIARRLAWVALLLALLSSLGWRAGLGVGGSSMAAQPKHKYEIMLTVSNDRRLEQRMDTDFITALGEKGETSRLSVHRSGKPWTDTETCKNDQHCDRIAIDAESRQLLITCNGKPQKPQDAPICTAPEKDRQKICIEPLPKQLATQLWNHSKAFHQGEDW